MRQESHVMSLVPGAAVAAYRIVKHGTADNKAIQAAAATDKSFGVACHLGAVATDDTVDVVVSGVAEVEYGGTVARGDLLTADADGKAITTTTANNSVIGRAMMSGVSGDIGAVLVAPSNL